MASKLNRKIGEMYEKSSKEVEKAIKAAEKPISIKTSKAAVTKSTASIFGKAAKSAKEFYNRNRADFKYLLLAIPIIVSFLIVREVQRYQSWKMLATTHQATLSIQPASTSLPPEGTLDVWVNSDSTIGFSDLEITFNKDLIRLTSEITTYDMLNRTVKVSSMAEANSSGRISIILGIEPSRIAFPPTGAFRIATFKVNAVTANPILTNIIFDTTSILMVSMDQSAFAVTATGSQLSLNPLPTPTPGSTVIPTSTPGSTPSPTPAANFQLSGIVTDASSLSPIPNVSIKIQKSTGGRTITTVKTDSYGHYGVYLPGNTYKLTISKQGYRTNTQVVTINTNSIFNIQLTRK